MPIIEEPSHPYGENVRTTHSGYSWSPGHPPKRTEAEPHSGGITAQETHTDIGPTLSDGEPGAWHYPSTPFIAVKPVSLEEARLVTAIAQQFSALQDLFWDRQRKYGPGNIARFGDYGVLVRCADKLARLERHYAQGVGDMPDESVEDAWSDLAVYATIALVCRRGAWPGWEGGKR